MKNKLLTTFLLALIFIPLVSAWPYQLNLTDGTLIDLNTSANLSATNLTIYIIHTNNTSNYTINPSYYNNTYIDVTNKNVTLQNITCINCTNNYHYNGTGTYNKSELQNYTLLTDFNSYKANNYALKTDINSVNTRIDELVIPEKTSHVGLWITVILSVLIGLVALTIIFRG